MENNATQHSTKGKSGLDAISSILFGVLCSVVVNTALGEEIVCHWAHNPIEVDGRDNESDWSQASLIHGFRVPDSSGRLSRTATRAKLLWDRQFLYFFAELEDHDLFADVIEHDGRTWENDVFEIFLKPSRQASGYYEFQVNAAGTEMDMFLPDRTSGGYDLFRSSNNFHWKTHVRRDGTLNRRDDRDNSWTVEGKIPWLDLMPTGGRPELDEVWQVALCRYDYTQGQPEELSSSAGLTRPDFHHHADYSNLRFASGSETSATLRSLTARPNRAESKVAGSPEPPLPYRAVRAFPKLQLEWPIDVKVEPGSERFIVIEEQGPYGPTKLLRTSKESDFSDLELLLDPNGVAYNIAFHPHFASNGFMYVGSNGKSDEGLHRSRIVRHTLSRSPPFEVVGDPVTIIDWESNGHNGAAITFGIDGMMYVTSGDGSSDSDANVTGQDLTKLLAKVLRIDVDHPQSGKNYSVPNDNPFTQVPGAMPETWAYGLRNPWRITTDSKTGHLWLGNNGQDMWEQVYLVERGANYGWSVFEGGHPFYSKRTLGPTPHVLPTVDHPHSEARSLTGGVVYYGNKLPELQGAYVYGDYSTGKIWAIKHDGASILWQREIADTPFQISAISLDGEGELIVVDHRGDKQGGLYHLELSPVNASPNLFPRMLSQTGLFQQVAGHKISVGIIPYSVNAPFWSDGATKSRFIALPKDGQIELTDQWAWLFPEKTVIIKSFALELVDGDPASTKWIETRLLAKEQGEWVGYSYAWNDEQTEAFLVDAMGIDQTFSISEATGVRSQTWHYPSRTECMVCHTRAAGYLLGLTTVQMNKEHDYGDGIQANQLDALEAMGVLQANWVTDSQASLRSQMGTAGATKEEIDSHLSNLKVYDGQPGVRSKSIMGKSGAENRKLVDPYETSVDLEQRARSFLHSNCAYCHIEAGGGNAKMNLAFYASLDQMNILEVTPTHHHFEKLDAKLVARGSFDRSVLPHRAGIRGPGQMPQLSTNRIDEKALKMLKEWIDSMQ